MSSESWRRLGSRPSPSPSALPCRVALAPARPPAHSTRARSPAPAAAVAEPPPTSPLPLSASASPASASEPQPTHKQPAQLRTRTLHGEHSVPSSPASRVDKLRTFIGSRGGRALLFGQVSRGREPAWRQGHQYGCTAPSGCIAGTPGRSLRSGRGRGAGSWMRAELPTALRGSGAASSSRSCVATRSCSGTCGAVSRGASSPCASSPSRCPPRSGSSSSTTVSRRAAKQPMSRTRDLY